MTPRALNKDLEQMKKKSLLPLSYGDGSLPPGETKACFLNLLKASLNINGSRGLDITFQVATAPPYTIPNTKLVWMSY